MITPYGTGELRKTVFGLTCLNVNPFIRAALPKIAGFKSCSLMMLGESSSFAENDGLGKTANRVHT